MAENQQPTICGILYAKDKRTVPNKKQPTEPDFEFLSIKVETKEQTGRGLKANIPEIHLDRGVNYDLFEVGDPIEVDIYHSGKAISPTWYKSEIRGYAIRHTDIQRATTPDRKQHMNSITDPSELDKPSKPLEREKETVFTGQTGIPGKDDLEDEYSDLPF